MTYLVEFHRPSSDRAEFTQISNRARTVAEQMSHEGTTVRYLHGLYIPSEETGICLYDTSSEDAVRQAASRAELPLLRITEVIYDGVEG
jgi:hypothetical protein